METRPTRGGSYVNDDKGLKLQEQTKLPGHEGFEAKKPAVQEQQAAPTAGKKKGS